MNGDIAAKVSRVLRECAQLKYPKPIDEVGLRMGDPVVLLPILHFVLLKFSRHVALCIHKAGYELQGKTDQKFVENAFRLFRDCFSIRTVLTPAHFLEQGFAERKLILVSEVVQACKKIHNDEIRKERLAALKTKQGPGAESRQYEPTRKTPEIKVVKNGVETRQVVRAQHLQNATDGGQSLFKVKKTISSPQGANGHVTALKDSAPSPHHRPADLPLRSPRTSPLSLRSPTAAPRASPHPPPAPMAPPDAPSEASPPAWADITLKPSGLAAALSTPIHSWFVNPTFHEPPQTRDSLGSALPAANGGGWRGAGDAPARQLFGGTMGGGAAAWLGAAAQPQAPQTPEPQEGGAAASGVRGWQPTEGPGQGNVWDPPGSFTFFHAHPVQQPGSAQASASLGGGVGGSSGPGQADGDGAAAREAQRVEALTNSFLRGGWEFADGQATGDQAAAGGGVLGNGWQGVGVHVGHAGTGEDKADGQSESHMEPSLHVGMGGDGDVAEDLEPWGSHGMVATAAEAGVPGDDAWLTRGRGAGQGIVDYCEKREDAVADGLGEEDGGQRREEGALQGVSAWVAGQQEQQPPPPQLLAALQRQLEEMRARLEQVDRQAEHVRAHAERSAMESEALHVQHAAALEALQARTTVLEGRVRYLECELQVCVRRGEYDPNPQLVSVSQDPQLAGGSGSPSGGAQERGALHNHAGRHSASLSSQQQQQQQQQQDLLPPHPVQSTPRLTEPTTAWSMPPSMTSTSRSGPHNSNTTSTFPPPPPPTANSHTALTGAAATKHAPWPPTTPSLHSVPSLPFASPASPLHASQPSGLGSKAARQLWQGSGQSGTSGISTAATTAAAAAAAASPLQGSMRSPLGWKHDHQQQQQQQRSSTSGSTAGGGSRGSSSAPPPVTPSLLAPMPSFSFQPSMPAHNTVHTEQQQQQQQQPLIAPTAACTADQQGGGSGLQDAAGTQGELGISEAQPPLHASNPYLMRCKAGTGGAGMEAAGHGITAGGGMPPTQADQSYAAGAQMPAPADASSAPSATSKHNHGAGMPPVSVSQQPEQLQLSTPSALMPDTNCMQPPASMPSAVSGSSGTARASHSSTSDLISSLYSRYTEAQSFLSALKSSKKSAP